MTAQVVLVGNATRDAEIKYSPSGTAMGKFSLAVTRKWQDKQTQKWEESTSFFNVVCWKELAENVSECVSKGTRVVVVGRLEQRSWETLEGEKRTTTEIVADEVAPSLRWATAEVVKNERRTASVGASEEVEW